MIFSRFHLLSFQFDPHPFDQDSPPMYSIGVRIGLGLEVSGEFSSFRRFAIHG